MSKLSERTGSGRHDVVPGHVLSPPRLREQGIAEDAFGRWFLERIDKGTRYVESELRRELMKFAAQKVADGYFSIGMPGHSAMIMSARGTRLAFWLSLRVKHPQITYAGASVLLDGADESRVTPAVLSMWGLEPSEIEQAEPNKPIDWDAIYERLCNPAEMGGLGYDIEEVNDLTMSQVVALITGGKSKAPDINKVAKAKQGEVFDKICMSKKLTPDQLAALPVADVSRFVHEIIGDKPLDEKTLTASLAAYAPKKAA